MLRFHEMAYLADRHFLEMAKQVWTRKCGWAASTIGRHNLALTIHFRLSLRLRRTQSSRCTSNGATLRLVYSQSFR